jgi:hypothetical protein
VAAGTCRISFGHFDARAVSCVSGYLPMPYRKELAGVLPLAEPSKLRVRGSVAASLPLSGKNMEYARVAVVIRRGRAAMMANGNDPRTMDNSNNITEDGTN